jgi:hypothetical protein
MINQRSIENDRRREARRQKQIKNTDRDNYCSEHGEKSRFIVCAMCGIEDSQTGSIPVADNEDLLAKCGIREEYEAYVKISDDSTMYDKIFIEEAKKHFDVGLIKGLKSICALCRSDVSKKNKK